MSKIGLPNLRKIKNPGDVNWDDIKKKLNQLKDEQSSSPFDQSQVNRRLLGWVKWAIFALQVTIAIL